LIKEIALVKPTVLIEKNARGEFNFSDLAATKKPAAPAAKKPAAKPPFDLLVASFSIKDGKVTYIDQWAKSINEVKKLDFYLSGFEAAFSQPMSTRLSALLTYQGKEIPLSLSGKVAVNLAEEAVEIPSLALNLAGESASASASIKLHRTAPEINFAVSSEKLSIDPLLALFAGAAEVKKPKPQPGELTKTVNRAMASLPKNLSVNGKLNIKNLSLMNFKVDKIDLSLGLRQKIVNATINEIAIYNGAFSGTARVDLNASGLAYSIQNLKLQNFNASPFTNAVVETFLTGLPDYKDLTNKVYGTLDLSVDLRGSGVETNSILANLEGKGSFRLVNGELKRVKTLAEIGKTIKSNSLQQDLKFGQLSSRFSIKNKVVQVADFNFDNPEFKLLFNGGIDIGRLTWVPGNRLTTKLSPAIGQNLPQEFSLFKDQNGWWELTFEITGSLKKPIPKPILEKPLEKAVGKIKVEIEAKKIEIEQKAQQALTSKEAEAQKALEAEKARLQEEAKKKLQEMIKF
jgi:uncharacterized protein involved in outer membrane biogenesis